MEESSIEQKIANQIAEANKQYYDAVGRSDALLSNIQVRITKLEESLENERAHRRKLENLKAE